MRRLFALLLVLALVAASCGGTDTTEGTDAAAESSGASEATDSESGGESGTASTDASTLEEFFGWGEFDERDWQEQERQVEELVAACMAELGWEYQPVDYSSQDQFFDPFEDVGEKEWAERYGYGATTFILEDPFLEAEEGESFEFEDPNQEYVQSLSEIEVEQYYEDLYGQFDEPEIDPDTGEYLEEDFFFDPDNGCYNQASAEIYGFPEDPGEEADYEAVFDLFEQLEEQISADERVIEAEGKWSECMADKGFAYDRPRDAAEHFYMEADKFWQLQEESFVDPFEGWTEDEIDEWFVNTPPEEQDDFFSSFDYGPNFDEATTAEIEALSKEEIETAVADYECSLEFRDLQEQIREEYEGRFIQENLEQLTEMKDAGFF